MTPKTWQDVLLRREYLRGYQDGVWGPPMKHLTELAELETLKPCPECNAEGYVYFARDGDGEGSMGPCNFCLGTWIARRGQEDEDIE